MKSRNRQNFIGEVVSDKMDKTIVIKITTKKLHPLYKKYVRWTKKIKAHDEKNIAKIGDIVKVEESRPISKTKTWKLVEKIASTS